MGYFLDYELFTPCWHCGKTDCNGDHPQHNNYRRNDYIENNGYEQHFYNQNIDDIKSIFKERIHYCALECQTCKKNVSKVFTITLTSIVAFRCIECHNICAQNEYRRHGKYSAHKIIEEKYYELFK